LYQKVCKVFETGQTLDEAEGGKIMKVTLEVFGMKRRRGQAGAPIVPPPTLVPTSDEARHG
jgi:hypothetical protein